MCDKSGRQAGAQIQVGEDDFVQAVTAEIMSRFQDASVDGLVLPEWEAQALARGSWMRLTAKPA